MNSPLRFGGRVKANRKGRCRTVTSAVVMAMEYHSAITAVFTVAFFNKIQTLRCKVRIEKYVATLLRVFFESVKGGNEFSCEMVFTGECLDLIKFAIGTIMYHKLF